MSNLTNAPTKPTNIPWLGDIPADWEVRRLKSIIKSSKNGAWGSDPKNNENDVICLRVADFDSDNYSISDKKLTIRNIENHKELLVQKGDLLFEKSGGGDQTLVGRMVLINSNINAVTSNFLASIKLKPCAEPKYIHRLMSFYYNFSINYRSIKQTTGIQNIDSDEYFNEVIPLPPLQTQTDIASYLDTKCELIAKYIVDKTKIIELLKEQKKSLIYNAVTKGLDPNSKLKPSGVEWLGDIPADWEVVKLKQVCKFEYGESLSSENRKNGEVPVYGSNGITGYHDQSITNAPTIIIGRKGSFGKINISNIPCFPIDTTFFIDNTKTNQDLYWLNYILPNLKLDEVSDDSAVPGLSRENAYNNYIPLPPLKTQQQIVIYLDTQTAIIDDTISKIQREIELIQEYKKSLIYNAVTGKITV